MRKSGLIAVAAAAALAFVSICCREQRPEGRAKEMQSIVASDTILSGMSESLLPSEFFAVTAILPPGQCPGHYDVKLSDIARVKGADLVVSFIDMPFMQHAAVDAKRQLFIDAEDRNWMTPRSYITGLGALADTFSTRFPEHRLRIAAQRERVIQEVTENEASLSDRMKRAGVFHMPAIASSMLREPLEWMGFRIVGEYGRPESLSAKEIAALIRIGRERKAVMVVDNLQSGPDAGKGVAEALGVPHVILSNFPSEEGYAATLEENVDAVLTAMRTR